MADRDRPCARDGPERPRHRIDVAEDFVAAVARLVTQHPGSLGTKKPTTAYLEDPRCDDDRQP
jgi:hypothetical protein